MPVRNREATDANVSAVNRAVRYVPRELASSPQGGPCADAEDGPQLPGLRRRSSLRCRQRSCQRPPLSLRISLLSVHQVHDAADRTPPAVLCNIHSVTFTQLHCETPDAEPRIVQQVLQQEA